jgi:ATP-dependent DNA ligase
MNEAELKAAKAKETRERLGSETKGRLKKVPYGFMLSQAFRPEDWNLNSDYVIEIKVDGAYTMLADGKLFTRRGHEITHRFPELHLNRDGVVLGELCVEDEETGLTTFKRILTRNTDDPVKIRLASLSNRAVFHAFDMLRLADGTDISGLPFGERRKHLEAWFGKKGPKGFKLVNQIPVNSPDDVAKILAKAKELNLEGIMLKSLDGRYFGGLRTREWMKVKIWCDGLFPILKHGPSGTGDGYVLTIDLGDGRSQEVNCGGYEMRKQLANGEFLADIQYQRIEPDSGRMRFPTLKRLKQAPNYDSGVIYPIGAGE